MAKVLTRWITKRIFEIAALIAVAAVLVSCVGTFRALDALPQIQRELVSLEEQLEKLSGIRSILVSTMWRVRVLAFSGDEAFRTEIAAVVSRGEQLVDEVLSGNPSAAVKAVVLDCQDQLSQTSELTDVAAAPSDEDRAKFCDQGDFLEFASSAADRRRSSAIATDEAVGG